MTFLEQGIFRCLCAFVACFAYGFVVNIRGKKLIYVSLGGMLGWIIYLLSSGIYKNDIPQYFLAAVAVSVYAEIMARVNKVPVTVYLAIALLPLVPGGTIYRAMLDVIDGNANAFLEKLLYTFGVAGAIALGVFAVSSLTRLITEAVSLLKRKRGNKSA